MKEIGIMEVGGFRVGQEQDEAGGTGCTVILFDESSPAGVDVRGGGPASRETPLLNPAAHCSGLNAIVLAGGSAFGLDAAGGVMRYLEERNIGYDVGVTKVPLVCQSGLFDLQVGRVDVRPDGGMAYRACEHASADRMQEGNVGAGTGCTVGKLAGKEHAMKSGIGSFALQLGSLKVGAIVAVNALGDVFDADTGKQIAGMQTGGVLQSSEMALWRLAEQPADPFNGNTTLGVLLTNGSFDKTELNKIASMTHNGYARTIRPVHTTADGDSIYAVSVGKEKADLNAVGSLAAYVMAKAVNRAVLAAKSAYGYPGAGDVKAEL